jgi:mono/diheme cytochrome c family protein
MLARLLLCAALAAPALSLAQAMPTEFPLLRSWAQGAELDGEPKAPPAATLEERLARGKELFGPTCVRCHGHDSRGGGAAGYGMEPRPANLVDAPVKFRSTPPDAKPTELDLFRTITRGIHGTGMPAFADWSEADRWALAAYVRSIQPGKEAPALEVPEPPADLESLVERGATLAAANACTSCHAAGAAGPRFEKHIPKRSRDPAELYLTLRLGIPGTAMVPRDLAPEDLWALVAWVRSRLPAPGSQGMNVQEQEALTQVIDACANNL